MVSASCLREPDMSSYFCCLVRRAAQPGVRGSSLAERRRARLAALRAHCAPLLHSSVRLSHLYARIVLHRFDLTAAPLVDVLQVCVLIPLQLRHFGILRAPANANG